ncbi:MAG TPA: gamma-glutamyl-gamma-aminobutyrate hydrolase family protein [Hypericibacter adhaerens]|uniref:gamma-glutamyl-gamma-aminobutyrate hydrolase family protein n=1 Tax=Hypericibacter adhaerens TaxID=2602016 RepID=UPI002C6E6FAE|nr:gamma-glutamyl-gamma-aminobutyrate hydrolase family protein [Hypericibacter adhaerens]HWA43702.1 gamma-glutamyl-gamma-aminobutyrate hydrolase family protein [Hypericibacter adhaerens]
MSARNGKTTKAAQDGGRPTIGVTLDSEEPGGYSKFPWYAVRQNYADAVVKAGGLPLFLPHEPDQVADYLALIDGLVVTGGAFDIDPSLFGAKDKHPTVKLKGRRTEFEWKITQAAVAADLPVLGICGGQQLLNVVLGGTLIQHIPDEVEGPLAHEQPNPRNEPGHSVRIVSGTLLHKITGAASLAVNSAHHQAAKSVGPGILVDATAEDGVIEGIEDPRHRFVLGVQWHPEFSITKGDEKIFKAFVDAAKG